MTDFSSIGKILIGLGVFLLFLGVIFLLLNKISGIGHLPGDFYFSKGNFRFYFPLATSLILSIVLTIILNLVFRR